jgi:Flp pilus assembly protein TadG
MFHPIRRRARTERGAAFVEMALIAPVLFALLLGIVTAGMTYSRKISLDTAARDASRYAATLPVSNYPNLNAWLAATASVAQQSATSDLNTGVAGRSICVAYVYPTGSTANDQTTMLVRTDAGDTYTTGSSATCFADGQPAATRRVQVALARQTSIEAIIYTSTFTLSSQGLTRFEAS